MIDILNLNENKPFVSKILNTELIRTGSNSSGSCFFYAIYTPFKEFRILNEEQKMEYIKQKREDLADQINLEEWFSIQNGNVAFLQIIENMRKIIHVIKELILDESNSKYLTQYNADKLSFEILFTLLDPKEIENEILPQWDIECSNKKENEFIESIKNSWYNIYKNKIQKSIDNLEKKLDSNFPKMDIEKKLKIIQKLSMLSYPIFDFVTSKALSDFKEDIKNPEKWLNIFIFNSVLQFLNMKVNILIIDSETGMPYEGMKLIYKKDSFDNNYPFIVILYFKEIHFETLGKKVTVNNKTIINRLFKKDDPFIITYLTYLENEDEL